MNKILLAATAVAFMLPALASNAAINPSSNILGPVLQAATDVAVETTEVAHYKKKHKHKHYKAKKRHSCKPWQHKHSSRPYCHSHTHKVKTKKLRKCPVGKYRCIRNKNGDIVKILAGGAILYGIYKHLEDKF